MVRRHDRPPPRRRGARTRLTRTIHRTDRPAVAAFFRAAADPNLGRSPHSESCAGERGDGRALRSDRGSTAAVRMRGPGARTRGGRAGRSGSAGSTDGGSTRCSARPRRHVVAVSAAARGRRCERPVALRHPGAQHRVWNPLLLAREAATVDLLTDGRLELGFGAGHAEVEFRPPACPIRRPVSGCATSPRWCRWCAGCSQARPSRRRALRAEDAATGLAAVQEPCRSWSAATATACCASPPGRPTSSGWSGSTPAPARSTTT